MYYPLQQMGSSMQIPDAVILCDVGPRDGFQYEDTRIPTDLKVQIIRGLAEAGLPRIQVASFVHPEWVPQMADAEDVVAQLPEVDGVRYSGLALNLRGVERANAAGLKAIDLSIATWDEHSLDNANMSVDEAVVQAITMVERALAFGMEVQIGLQTAFGFKSPGDTPMVRVLEIVGRFVKMGVESISLADTTGMANPMMIAERVDMVRDITADIPLVLHLHDTRGLGMVNVYEAIRRGIDRFDTSLAAMGGCPFIQGAAGNIATEDTAYLLETLGISTGVDIERVAACSRRIAEFLGKSFPGRLYRIAR
jgi:hydroxymethylglutaryl-CoA lyase